MVIRKCHNHTLQTKTRPDIIIHFIKQRDQFHFNSKLYAQKCMSVSVSFVPNVVVQHVNCFVVCCIETTHYKRKVPSYLLVMWHTMLVSVYTLRYSHRTKLLSQNNRSHNRDFQTVPNSRKLIYAMYNFIVASWCLLFSYSSHLNMTTRLNGIFCDVYFVPIGIVII